MGYNPDSNFDGGIGSEDLMGMLSLFGSPFNSGDSLVVEYSIIEENADGILDTLFVSEDVDIIYLSTSDYTSGPINVILPQGNGWKSLMLLYEAANSDIVITDYDNNYIGQFYYRGWVLIFRGHNGVWYANPVS